MLTKINDMELHALSSCVGSRVSMKRGGRSIISVSAQIKRNGVFFAFNASKNIGSLSPNAGNISQDTGNKSQDAANASQNICSTSHNAGSLSQNTANVSQRAANISQNTANASQNSGNVSHVAGNAAQDTYIITHDVFNALQTIQTVISQHKYLQRHLIIQQ